MKQSQQQTVHIEGMHCSACEVLIERAFKQLPGVEKVIVKRSKQKAHIICEQEIPLDQLNNSIREHGYTVSAANTSSSVPPVKTRAPLGDRLTEIGAAIIILGAIYLLALGFGFKPSTLGVTENMSYGFVLLLGIVAAFSSCLSVTGGLLLSVITTQRELHPELTGKQLMRSQIFFNVGRLASYAILGGVIGAVGSALTLSPTINAIIMIVASVIMILLGLQLIDLFPWLQRFQLRMPKRFAHAIYGQAGKPLSAAAPFWFGAATFFFPCGFTQALQLYVLSRGNWLTGSLTMLVFALGTLPALLSIGAITSYLKKQWLHYVQVGAGVLVIVLGIFNINNGLALAGTPLSFSLPANDNTTTKVAAADPNVKLVNGVQVVDMKVNGLNYEPSRFTIKAGTPVEWRVDGTQAAGCARILVARSLGLQELLPTDSVKSIRFTAKQTGKIAFSCIMGMTTPGASFTVVN